MDGRTVISVSYTHLVETEEEFTEEEYSQLQGLSASKEYKEENLTENLQIVPKLEMKIKICLLYTSRCV